MSLTRDPKVVECVNRLELPFGQDGIDPYGVSKAELIYFLSMLAWFYRNWFQVRAHGVEHVPKRGRGMLVGNHSGGVAIDGMTIFASLLLEMEPPRLVHGMAEKFIYRVPFLSSWASRMGHFAGLPEHAERLLADERLLLVFPEGARGTAKLYWERNSLVEFGTGFMRLAIANRTPIIPFAFLGGGEAFPTIKNLYGLGKLLGVPYIPVPAYLIPLPRPARLEIHYSEPMWFEGTGREEDEVISGYVDKVKERVANLIASGKERVRRR